MSDLKKYLATRKTNDSDFADGYDEGYQLLKFGVLLKEARKGTELSQDDLALKIVLENIEKLPFSEKALAAHCLLNALDKKTDNDVDAEWPTLIESRREKYKSGDAKLDTWTAIKSRIVD